jgi:hypothetical protein
MSGIFNSGRVPDGLGVGDSVLAGSGGSCAQIELSDRAIAPIAKRNFIRLF